MSELHVDSLPRAERIRIATDMGYFPVVVTTPDGALVAVFRAGAGHMGRSGHLVASRSEDGGRTWSAPVVVANTRQYDDRNPAVGVAKDGMITVAYHANAMYDAKGQYMTDRRNPKAVHTGLVHSTDGGRTWGEPMLFTDHAKWDAMSPYGRILTLPDGAMAMPIYGEKSWLLWSRDGGRTWGDLTFVADDVNETAFCPLPSGEWLFLGRTSLDEERYSLLRWSSDGGRTWSAPTKFFAGRRLPSDLAVLPDGSVLAVYGYREEPYGARARRSTDGGRTWSETELVLHDKSRNIDCGYPSVVIHDGWAVMLFYDAGATTTYDGTGAFCEAVRVPVEDLIEVLR